VIEEHTNTRHKAYPSVLSGTINETEELASSVFIGLIHRIYRAAHALSA